MKIEQRRPFFRAFKRLKPAEKQYVEEAIRHIATQPAIGEFKRGDLSGFYVHKFKMNRQLLLLAYRYNEQVDTLYLEAFGPHENFYRDLKKYNM